MNEKMELQVKKGFRFSFKIPKSIASKVINLAFVHDVETSYKNMAQEIGTTLIKGTGSEEQVGEFVSNCGALVEDRVSLMEMLNSFKYKAVEFAEPVVIPFVITEEKKIVKPIKK